MWLLVNSKKPSLQNINMFWLMFKGKIVFIHYTDFSVFFSLLSIILKPASNKWKQSHNLSFFGGREGHTGFINTVKWKTDSWILRGPNMSSYVRKKSTIKAVEMNSIFGPEVLLLLWLLGIIIRDPHEISSNSKMFKTIPNKHFCGLNLNTN